jgi:hypothetical protein
MPSLVRNFAPLAAANIYCLFNSANNSIKFYLKLLF